VAKVERLGVNGVLGDTLSAYANGQKGDWDLWLPYAVLAINNSASTLGGELAPFFIDRRPTLACPSRSPTFTTPVNHHPPTPPVLERVGRREEIPGPALRRAAGTHWQGATGRGQVDTVFRVGDQVLLRTKEVFDAAEIGNLRPR
jgi:hypothetical protein